MAYAQLDHIVISAGTLADGVAWVEDTLGLDLAPGGEHPDMGTHNRLLSLGPDDYLEVIAVNPAAPAPPWPRIFGLDGFSGPPRLSNWVMRVADLDAALALAPPGTGEPVSLSRGENRWRMARPAAGQYPFGGAAPGLIEWLTPPPAPRLPDSGCRLRALDITHPEAPALSAALAPLLQDARVTIRPGDAVRLSAEIDTPAGRKVLG